MKKTITMTAGVIAAIVASGAIAQDATFRGQDAATTAVSDLRTQIREDARRDLPTFGTGARATGWTGSFALRGSMSKGNSDVADLGAGARLGYFDGVNGHRLNLSYAYGEKSGAKTKESLMLGYDYTRDFGSNLYAFGKVNVTYDRFSAYRSDAFVGAGLGYRVIDSDTTQWSVQAGPGYREARLSDNSVAFKSGAAAVSSYFKTSLSEGVALTNDTDVLWSKDNTRVTNDLGVSMAMTRSLALRTSLLTTYNTAPQPGFKKADNTLGVSLVYSFN